MLARLESAQSVAIGDVANPIRGPSLGLTNCVVLFTGWHAMTSSPDKHAFTSSKIIEAGTTFGGCYRG